MVTNLSLYDIFVLYGRDKMNLVARHKMNLVARRCTRSIVEMLLTDCGAQT